jgi:hypothetical protein
MMSCNARPPSPLIQGERRIEAPQRTESQRPDSQRASDADAFERVMRQKSRDEDDDGCDERGGDGDAPPPPTPDGTAPPPALRAAPMLSMSASHALSCMELPAAIVAAASRAALAGEAPASIATTLQPDTTQAAWEVSVQEPGGVDVSLRATRAGVAPAAHVQTPWDLSIASQGLDRATLARHASRLDERLRARGLAPGHLRIEDKEGKGS